MAGRGVVENVRILGLLDLLDLLLGAHVFVFPLTSSMRCKKKIGPFKVDIEEVRCGDRQRFMVMFVVPLYYSDTVRSPATEVGRGATVEGGKFHSTYPQ